MIKTWENVVRNAYLSACKAYLAGNFQEHARLMAVYKEATRQTSVAATYREPIPDNFLPLANPLPGEVTPRKLERTHAQMVRKQKGQVITSLRGRQFTL